MDGYVSPSISAFQPGASKVEPDALPGFVLLVLVVALVLFVIPAEDVY